MDAPLLPDGGNAAATGPMIISVVAAIAAWFSVLVNWIVHSRSEKLKIKEKRSLQFYTLYLKSILADVPRLGTDLEQRMAALVPKITGDENPDGEELRRQEVRDAQELIFATKNSTRFHLRSIPKAILPGRDELYSVVDALFGEAEEKYCAEIVRAGFATPSPDGALERLQEIIHCSLEYDPAYSSA